MSSRGRQREYELGSMAARELAEQGHTCRSLASIAWCSPSAMSRYLIGDREIPLVFAARIEAVTRVSVAAWLVD